MPHMTVSQAATALAKQNVLSQHAASLLSQADRDVLVPNVENLMDDPVMSCLVMDASGSMSPYADAVIEGQGIAITTLRGSAKCRDNALFVSQYLFSDTPMRLHYYTPLSRNGSDEVVLLDTKNYSPDGYTALYTTIFQVLQDMVATADYSLKKKVRTTFTVAVITDGEDNRSKVKPDDVKAVLQELRAKKYLRKSLVIGIKNADLPPAKITAIQQTLGFDEAISVEQSPSEIRRAFVLASQSAVRSQQ